MKSGDFVRLKKGVSSKKGRRATAMVVTAMSGIYKGGIILDKKLDGSRYWNKEDLEISNGIGFQK